MDYQTAAAYYLISRNNKIKRENDIKNQENINYCMYCGNKLSDQVEILLFGDHKDFVKICNICLQNFDYNQIIKNLWIRFSEVTLSNKYGCSLCKQKTKHYITYHKGPSDNSVIFKTWVCDNCFFQNWKHDPNCTSQLEEIYKIRKRKKIRTITIWTIVSIIFITLPFVEFFIPID